MASSPRPAVSPRPPATPRVGGMARPPAVTPLPLSTSRAAPVVETPLIGALYSVLSIVNGLDVAAPSGPQLLTACELIVRKVPAIKPSFNASGLVASHDYEGRPAKAVVALMNKHLAATIIRAGTDTALSNDDFMALYAGVRALAVLGFEATALTLGHVINQAGMLVLDPVQRLEDVAMYVPIGELHLFSGEGRGSSLGTVVTAAAAAAAPPGHRALDDIPFVRVLGQSLLVIKALISGDGHPRPIGLAAVHCEADEPHISLFYVDKAQRCRFAWHAMCSVLEFAERDTAMHGGYRFVSLLTADLPAYEHVLSLASSVEPCGARSRIRFALPRAGLIPIAARARQLVSAVNQLGDATLRICADELLLLAQLVLGMTPKELDASTNSEFQMSLISRLSRCMYDRIVLIHASVVRTTGPAMCSSDGRETKYTIAYTTRKLAEWASEFAQTLTLTDRDAASTWAWSTALNRRVISAQANHLCGVVDNTDVHVPQNGEVAIIELSEPMRVKFEGQPFMVRVNRGMAAEDSPQSRWFVVYTIRGRLFVSAGLVQTTETSFGSCVERFEMDECYRGTRVEYSAFDCIIEYLGMTPVRARPRIVTLRSAGPSGNMVLYASRGFVRIGETALAREVADTCSLEHDTIGPLARLTTPEPIACQTCEVALFSETKQLLRCVVKPSTDQSGTMPSLICERCLNLLP